MNASDAIQQFLATGSYPTSSTLNQPDPNYVANYLSRLDGAAYMANRDNGTLDQGTVTPETMEVINSSPAELEAKLGREGASLALRKVYEGVDQYNASVNASRSAGEIMGDTLASVGSGLVGMGAGIVEGQAAGLDSILNAFRENPDYNFTRAVNNLSTGVRDFLDNTLTSNTRQQQRYAEQARDQARADVNRAQYQRDLANGEDATSAGLAYFGRGFLNMVQGAFDSPSRTLETTADVVGSLGGMGLAIKGGTKLALKANKALAGFIGSGNLSAKAARITSAGVMNAMAVGGEGVSSAIDNLDSISDEELITGSPRAQQLYDSFLSQGQSPEEAMRLTRQRIEADILLPAYATGTLVGGITGGLFNRMLANPFTLDTARKAVGEGVIAKAGETLPGRMLKEGFEESVETAPTPVINYGIQQNADPNRNVLEGWGEEMGSSFIGGVLGGGAGAALSPIADRVAKRFTGSDKKNQGEETYSSGLTNKQRKDAQSEFNSAVETNDSSRLSARALTEGLMSSKLLVSEEGKENQGLSAVKPDENLSEEEAKYIQNALLDDADRAKVEALKKKGLIDPNTPINSKYDLYEALAKMASEGIVVDENGNQTINLTKDQYREIDEELDNLSKQLTWNSDKAPEDDRVKRYAEWMNAENSDLANRQKAMGELSYLLYDQELQGKQAEEANKSIRILTQKNPTNEKVDVSNNSSFGMLVRLAVGSANNLDQLTPSLKNPLNSESELETKELDKVINTLNAVKQGIDNGRITVNDENRRLITRALITDEFLKNWRATLKSQSKLRTTEGVANTNTTKVGDRTQQSEEAVDNPKSNWILPSATEHISRLLRAYMSNDVLGYIGARNSYDKFIATQHKKLLDLQKAYAVYEAEKSGKLNTTQDKAFKSGARYNINAENADSMSALAGHIMLENSLMGNMRNLLEVAMFGSKSDSEYFRENNPYNSKASFIQTDPNKKAPNVKKPLRQILTGSHSIVKDKTAKDAFREYLTSTQRYQRLFLDQISLAEEVASGTVGSENKVVNPSQFNESPSSENIIPSQEAETSTEGEPMNEGFTPETDTSENQGEASTGSETDTDTTPVVEDAESNSDDSMQLDEDTYNAVNDLLSRMENGELEQDLEGNTELEGGFLQQIPSDERHINAGARLYTVEQDVFKTINAPRLYNTNRQKYFTDGAAFFTQSEILTYSNSMKAHIQVENDLTNSRLADVPTDTTLGKILNTVHKKFTSSSKEPIKNKSIEDIKAKYKQNTLQLLQRNFEDDFKEIEDKFNNKQKSAITKLNQDSVVKGLVKELLELSKTKSNTEEAKKENKQREAELREQLNQKIFELLNNSYDLPLAVFSKIDKDVTINNDGTVSFSLKLDKDTIKVAYTACRQELYNQRNTATAGVNLDSPRWENVKFSKNHPKEEVFKEWEYAVNAGDVIQNISRKVKGYLHVKNSGNATDYDAANIDTAIGALLEPMDGKEFKITKATNPNILKRDLKDSPYKEDVDSQVTVFSFKKNNNETFDNLYQSDPSLRASTVADEFYDYHVDKSINLGSESEAILNDSNSISRRQHMASDRIGQYEQNVIKNRQSQKFTPNIDIFRMFSQHLGSSTKETIDNICKYFTGYTKSEVDEYFEFRRLTEENHTLTNDEWTKFTQKYGVTTDSTKTLSDQVNTYRSSHLKEFNYMSQLRSSQIPYIQGYETAKELLSAMKEALSENLELQDTDFINMSDADFLDVLKKWKNQAKSGNAKAQEYLDSISQHYGYQITVSGRLQDVTATTSPVTNKIVREMLTNIPSVTVQQGDLTKLSWKNPVLSTWALAIDQAFGTKLWKPNLAKVGKNVQEYLDTLPKLLGNDLWNTLQNISSNTEGASKLSEEDMSKIREVFEKQGWDINPFSLHALFDLAHFSLGKDFNSSMYIEVDSRSSGPSVMASRYNAGSFSEDEINLMESAGYMVFHVERPSDILSRDPSNPLKDDLYQNAGNKVIAEINDDLPKYYKKLDSKTINPSTKVRNAVLRVVSVLNPKFFFAEEDTNGNVIVSKPSRDSGKTTTTPLVYGSAISGIGNQKNRDYLAGLYTGLNKAAETLASQPDLLDKATSAKERRHILLKFIGENVLGISQAEGTSKEEYENALVLKTAQILADLDLAYSQALGIKKGKDNKVRVVINRDNSTTVNNFGWLLKEDGSALSSNEKALSQLTDLVTDGSKFDSLSEVWRNNIETVIADPAYRAVQAHFGLEIQQTMKDIQQTTNLANLLKSIINSIGITVYSGLNGSDRTMSEDQRRLFEQSKLGKHLSDINVPYGYDGSAHYPAFKDGIDRSQGVGRTEVHINNHTISIYRQTIATPLGQGGLPGNTQGSGDGDNVNQIITNRGTKNNFVTVFDGINIALNELKAMTEGINDALREGHKQNIYAGLLHAFQSVVDTLRDNPEFFNSENEFSFTNPNNDLGFYLLNLAVPSYLHDQIMIGNHSLAQVVAWADSRKQSDRTEYLKARANINEKVIKEALNLAIKHYQQKSFDCLAKRTVFHGLPTKNYLKKKFLKENKGFPIDSTWKTSSHWQEADAIPMGYFNMDSYGSSDNDVNFRPFKYRDANSNQLITCSSLEDWNKLSNEEKLTILNQKLENHKRYLQSTAGIDNLFPVRKFDVKPFADGTTSTIKARDNGTLKNRLAEIFSRTGSNTAQRRAISGSQNFMRRTLQALFNHAPNLFNNVRYVELDLGSNYEQKLNDLVADGIINTTQKDKFLDSINAHIRANGINSLSNIKGLTDGSVIIKNHNGNNPIDSTFLIHELVHVGLTEVLQKYFDNPNDLPVEERRFIGSLIETNNYFVKRVVTNIANSIQNSSNEELKKKLADFFGGTIPRTSPANILRVLLDSRVEIKTNRGIINIPELQSQICRYIAPNNQTSSVTADMLRDMFRELGSVSDIPNDDSINIKSATLDSMTDRLLNSAVANDELVAWTMSSYEINRIAQGIAVEPEKQDSFLALLMSLGNRLIGIFNTFLQSIGVKGNFRDVSNVANLMSQHVAVISGLYNQNRNVTQGAVRKAVATGSINENKADLMDLAKQIDSVTNKVMEERREYEPDVVKSQFAETKAWRDNMMNQLSAYGFRFSTAQLAVIRSVYTALAMGVKTNSKIYRQMSVTFTKALGAFNHEYLSPENRRNNPNEARQAMLKYRFLMGNYPVEDSNSNERATRLLPTFMAIAMVDPDLRNFLKEQKNVQNEPYTSDNNLEQSVVRGFVSGLETLDKLFNRTKNYDNSNLAQLLYAYTTSVLEDDRNGSFVSRATDGLTDAVDNAIEKVEPKVKDAVFTALGKPLSVLIKPLEYVPHLSPLAAAIRIALKSDAELPKGVSRMEILASSTYELGNSIPARFLQSMAREYLSRSPRTLDVMKSIKVCKDLTQVKSKRYREDMPKEVMKSLSSLKKPEWESLTRSIGKTDITSLATFRNNFSGLADLVSNKVNIKIASNAAYNSIANKYGVDITELQKYIKPLANYMATGRFTSASEPVIYDVQRNTDAIIRKMNVSVDNTTYESLRQDLDELVSLEALQRTDEKDLKTLNKILSNVENHKGFAEVWDILAKCKSTDRIKLANHGQLLNRWQGYLPMISTNNKQVAIVDSKTDTANALEILGYTKAGRYEKSPNDPDKRDLAYYTCDIDPEAQFMSGGLQLMNYTAGGVNLESGLSVAGIKPESLIDPDLNVTGIEYAISRNGNGKFPLIPIYKNNTIVGYERTADPRYTEDFVKVDMFLPSIIGNWYGRQNGESELRSARKEVIQELKNMYDHRLFRNENTSLDYKWINLFDPSVDKKYPHIKEGRQRLLSGSLREDIDSIWNKDSGKQPRFMVRVDMLEQVVGQRRASVSEIFLNPQSEIAKVAAFCIDKIIGSGRAIRWERNIQRGVVSLKNNIVVKSLKVPAQNITANVIELNMLGVPFSEIRKGVIEKTRECETYLRYQQELVRLEYQQAQQTANADALDKINKRIDEINTDIKKLTIYPLIEMGEFNTITDVTTIREDLALVQGNYGTMLDEKIEQLPDDVKKGLKQLVLTKDTGFYKLLAKATQYGDLVAKSILYDDVLKRQKKGRKQAEYMATTFFVDYDLMPGRTRDYLESIGLMWFYNYKLRMSKVLVHMFRENPLRLLLWGVTPQGLGFSALDTPLKDSFLGRLLGFGPALSGTAFAGAPGMVITALTSNPWLILAGLIL